MTEPSNSRRPKRGTWTAQPETVALLRSSGNEINGVGETTPRRPSPFFWHPPDQHPWGEPQLLARKNSRKCPESTEAFQGADTYPELISVADTRNESSPQKLAEAARSFALSREADDMGLRSWSRSMYSRATRSINPGLSFLLALMTTSASAKFLPFAAPRWIEGSTHVWIARSRKFGVGQGSSGSRFDVAEDRQYTLSKWNTQFSVTKTRCSARQQRLQYLAQLGEGNNLSAG